MDRACRQYGARRSTARKGLPVRSEADLLGCSRSNAASWAATVPTSDSPAAPARPRGTYEGWLIQVAHAEPGGQQAVALRQGGGCPWHDRPRGSSTFLLDADLSPGGDLTPLPCTNAPDAAFAHPPTPDRRFQRTNASTLTECDNHSPAPAIVSCSDASLQPVTALRSATRVFVP